MTEFKAVYLDFLISIVTTITAALWYICCPKGDPKIGISKYPLYLKLKTFYKMVVTPLFSYSQLSS
jgi:hypothetical protein